MLQLRLRVGGLLLGSLRGERVLCLALLALLQLGVSDECSERGSRGGVQPELAAGQQRDHGRLSL